MLAKDMATLLKTLGCSNAVPVPCFTLHHLWWLCQASAAAPLEDPQPDAAAPAAPPPSQPLTPARQESAPLVAAEGPPKSPPSTVLRQEEAAKIR